MRTNSRSSRQSRTSKKADVLKDEFLANTSHELRTPLNGIIGLAESLVNGAKGPLRENTLENLDLIVSSGRRLSSLVDDILDFSRMKNNELRLHIEPIAVEPQVSLVLQLSDALLQGKPVALKKEIPQDLSLLMGDHARYDISWFFRPMLSVGGDLLDVQQSVQWYICHPTVGRRVSPAPVIHRCCTTRRIRLRLLLSEQSAQRAAKIRRQLVAELENRIAPKTEHGDGIAFAVIEVQ